MRARVEFKLADMWIGVFWRKSLLVWACSVGDDPESCALLEADRIDVWICLIPCVPLHVVWQGKERIHDEMAAILAEWDEDE